MSDKRYKCPVCGYYTLSKPMMNETLILFFMNDKVSKWYENTKNVDEMLDWSPV